MNDRGLRSVATVLGLVLVFVAGFVIAFLLLPRTAGPAATARPSGSVTSPRPSVAPTSGTSARPTVPAGSGGPTESPTGPTGSADASGTPSIPLANATFYTIGLDNPASSSARDRVMTFTSEGTADVVVKVTGVSSGKVKVCLQYQSADAKCISVKTGTMTGTTKRASTNWTVRLSGSTNGTAATANLIVQFASRTPSLAMTDFRLAGTVAPNGVILRVTSRTTGAATFGATWTEALPYSLKTFDRTDPTVPPVDDSGGPSTDVNATIPTVAKHRYEIQLKATAAASKAIYLAGTVTWP